MHYIRIRTSTGKQTTIGDQSSGKDSVRRRMRAKILYIFPWRASELHYYEMASNQIATTTTNPTSNIE